MMADFKKVTLIFFFEGIIFFFLVRQEICAPWRFGMRVIKKIHGPAKKKIVMHAHRNLCFVFDARVSS